MAERGNGRRITITLTEFEKDILDTLTYLGETYDHPATGWRAHSALWSYLKGRHDRDPEVRRLVELRREHRRQQEVDVESLLEMEIPKSALRIVREIPTADREHHDG